MSAADVSGPESPATFYPDNLQTMRQEFAADRVNAAQENLGTSSAQNASNEGGSPLTADEMHDENFRRMLDKYYSEVDDGQQDVEDSALGSSNKGTSQSLSQTTED